MNLERGIEEEKESKLKEIKGIASLLVNKFEKPKINHTYNVAWEKQYTYRTFN